MSESNISENDGLNNAAASSDAPTGQNPTGQAEPRCSAPPTVSPTGTGGGNMSEKDLHMWGMFCHLAALAGFIGVPFGNLLGPLVVWLIKKNEHPFIYQQGQAALNFQISMIIYSFVAALLCFIVIGIPLLILLGVADLVLVIIAGIKASNGESFKYPCSIQFIKA